MENRLQQFLNYIDNLNKDADKQGEEIDRRMLGDKMSNSLRNSGFSPSGMAEQMSSTVGSLGMRGSKIPLAERALNNKNNPEYLSQLRNLVSDPNESKFIDDLWTKARAKDNVQKGQQFDQNLTTKRNTDMHLDNFDKEMYKPDVHRIEDIDLPKNMDSMDILKNELEGTQVLPNVAQNQRFGRLRNG